MSSYYPGLAESPPPPSVTRFYAKNEPIEYGDGFIESGGRREMPPPAQFVHEERNQPLQQPSRPIVNNETWSPVSLPAENSRFNTSSTVYDESSRGSPIPPPVNVHYSSSAISNNSLAATYNYNKRYMTDNFADGTKSGTSRIPSDYSDYRPQSMPTMQMKKSRFDEMEERRGPAAEYVQRQQYFYENNANKAGSSTSMPTQMSTQLYGQSAHNMSTSSANDSGGELDMRTAQSTGGHQRHLQEEDNYNRLLDEEKRREEASLMMLARQKQDQHMDTRLMIDEYRSQLAVGGNAFLADSRPPFIPTSSSDPSPVSVMKHEFVAERGGFFNGPPSSSSSSRKRPFLQMMGNDIPAPMKLSHCPLISYPAAPPAVLRNYADECRQSKNFQNQHYPQHDIQSPLEVEAQNSVLELRQELAFIDGLDPSISTRLNNSKRLLDTEATKREEFYNPEWLEVDINRPVKLSKQVLVPNFRYPAINYVGRILGFKGSTLQRICRKYKCFIAILGAYSTKDRQQELDLLRSGDYRFAHYGSPMHIRVDVIAPAHVAHMRMAGVLNIFHKLLVPNRDFDIGEYLADIEMSDKDDRPRTRNEKQQRWAEEEHRLAAEFDTALNESNNGRDEGRGGGRHHWSAGRGRSTGFKPRGRHYSGDNQQDDNNSSHSQQDAGGDDPAAAPFSTPPSQSRDADGVNTARGRGTGRGRGGGFVPRGMRHGLTISRAGSMANSAKTTGEEAAETNGMTDLAN